MKLIKFLSEIQVSKPQRYRAGDFYFEVKDQEWEEITEEYDEDTADAVHTLVQLFWELKKDENKPLYTKDFEKFLETYEGFEGPAIKLIWWLSEFELIEKW